MAVLLTFRTEGLVEEKGKDYTRLDALTQDRCCSSLAPPRRTRYESSWRIVRMLSARTCEKTIRRKRVGLTGFASCCGSGACGRTFRVPKTSLRNVWLVDLVHMKHRCCPRG